MKTRRMPWFYVLSATRDEADARRIIVKEGRRLLPAWVVLASIVFEVARAQTPEIARQPTNEVVVAGGAATFSVAVSGSGPFVYQWQFNGANVPNGVITTVAGNGTPGYSGDGGAATAAELGGLRYFVFGGEVSTPIGVAVDGSGDLFIADSGNNVVRKVEINGIISTVAGNGTPGYSGDGGAATAAELGNLGFVEFEGYLGTPIGVAVDGSGNLFIADAGNYVVRKVGTNGIISTVAGNGTNSDYGDGVAATKASLRYPVGVAVDTSGNLLIADSGSGAIRKVDTNGVITTVAGNGTNGYLGDGGLATRAELSSPGGVASDTSGGLFIADSGNNVVRKLDTNGIIATVAGRYSLGGGYSGDGGAATNAALNHPVGVAVDASGNLFIADEGNIVIRKVDPNGIITTAAGNGSGGYSGDGGAATGARLSDPTGVAVDTAGSLLIAAAYNFRIREVAFPGQALVLQDVGRASAGSYDVVVSSPYGSVTSAAATLTVLAPPFIVTQPADIAAAVGSAAALSVDAVGTPPLYYFWYLDRTNPVPSGTNSTLALGNVSLADAGGYTVVVTNLYGSVTSFVAALSAGYTPSIASEPSSQAAWAGSNVTLTAAVAGGGPYAFQWQQNGVRLANDLITTEAGGWLGDGGAATEAGLYDPSGLALDRSGNLFIADYADNRVRKVDTNGLITTVAGNGLSGYSGDGGAATNASLSDPNDVAVDGDGNLFIADAGNNRVRKVDSNGIISTVAGDGSYGYAGDGGAATGAKLDSPSGVAVDAYGNLFIADSNNQRIRTVGTNGIISTVAGDGSYGYAGDGGAATGAHLATPTWVAVDTLGSLFIADSRDQRVRKVGTNGIISTVAGNGTNGYAGDGGVATDASLSGPSAVALDRLGNLFIADSANNVIRKVGANGIISTVAGNGTDGCAGDGGAATNASLNHPLGVAVDASGKLFIGDSYNKRIRKVDLDGIITTVAGDGLGDGREATEAGLANPSAVAVDASGNLFIADFANRVIRKVDADGIITTVAGNGADGYSGDGGAATNASLNSPAGVAVSASGTLFISDSANNVIRKVDVNEIITTVAGNGTDGYSGDGGGAATNASLSSPAGVAADGDGNLFIADSGNSVIRKVDMQGSITTVAGSYSLFGGYSGDGGPATSANLSGPGGVTVDGDGNLFIADSGNSVIRKVDVQGIITTVAGNYSFGFGYAGDGGAATNAALNDPVGVAVDRSGNLFIADEDNSVIRKVDLNGIITTVAGNGNSGYSGDGGAATNANLLNPSGVAVGAYGNLLIADSGNNRIREVHFGGVPTLTLDDVSAANGGGYQVVISSPYGSVTSAVATLTVVWPTLNADLEAGPFVRITLRSAPGASYVLQAAESLAPPINWQSVSTNVADVNGNWRFTDTNTLNYPARFYRLQQP